jgi:hypothetical protein
VTAGLAGSGFGYQYLSHADVVTDHDVGTSALPRRLAADGAVRVHSEAPTGDDLVAIVDRFLGD